MQGATGERLCWYPLAQRLHVMPVTPSLQGHWPVVWLHVLPAAPTGWQSQAGVGGGVGGRCQRGMEGGGADKRDKRYQFIKPAAKCKMIRQNSSDIQ